MATAHPFPAGKFAWIDGRIEEMDPRSAIHLPLLSQVVDYGRGVISGIRITPHHNCPGKLLIFSLYDHVRRLLDSSRRLGLLLPFGEEALCQGAIEVVKANSACLLKGGYLRAVVFDARQILAPQAVGHGTVVIFAGPFGEYIPDGDFGCTFDEWLRIGDQGMTKAAANYVAFCAAKHRAVKLGLHDSLGVTVDRLGKLIVGEGTTSNAFFVFEDPPLTYGVRLATPPLSAGILAGITRMRVIELARDIGYEVEEEDVALSRVPLALEIFLTGTASYVAPLTHFGRHKLETEIGQRLNKLLRDLMAGRLETLSETHNTVVEVPQIELNFSAAY